MLLFLLAFWYDFVSENDIRRKIIKIAEEFSANFRVTDECPRSVCTSSCQSHAGSANSRSQQLRICVRKNGSAHIIVFLQAWWLRALPSEGLCFHGFGPPFGQAAEKSARDLAIAWPCSKNMLLAARSAFISSPSPKSRAARQILPLMTWHWIHTYACTYTYMRLCASNLLKMINLTHDFDANPHNDIMDAAWWR